jgi:hypothetical protein
MCISVKHLPKSEHNSEPGHLIINSVPGGQSMKCSGKLLILATAFLFSLPVFSENLEVARMDSEAKELKMRAHRLHIPVEQVKKARQVKRLFRRSHGPCPFDRE